MPEYFVHPSAIADPGCVIGEGTSIWHFCHIMPKASIGKNCSLGQNVFIGNGVQVGHGVKIQNNVSLYTGVVCKDDVFLGPSCVFTNVINPRAAINRKQEFKPTLIKKGASIGANATILCGLEIGEYAMVGAGAVITKSIPDFALVVGNPAKQIGWISAAGHRLKFNENGEAFCQLSGNRYFFNGESVTQVA